VHAARVGCEHASPLIQITDGPGQGDMLAPCQASVSIFVSFFCWWGVYSIRMYMKAFLWLCFLQLKLAVHVLSGCAPFAILAPPLRVRLFESKSVVDVG